MIQQPKKSPAAALPGFEPLGECRSGAQGLVQRMTELATSRDVAVKILRGGLLATKRERRRFEQEIRLLGRLNHPNLVRLFSSGEIEGRPYFVMEFVEGLPLDKWVVGTQATADEIVELLAGVCDGLHAAHNMGVIHRDLKPSNILVSVADEMPKIVDFGLAADSDDAVGVSTVQTIVGTLPYMAPEVVEGTIPRADAVADVYSAGVILYQMLAGELPIDLPSSRVEAMRTITTARPIPLRSRPQGRPVPRELAAIADKAVSPERSRRYQSAAAFAEDLRAYRSGTPVAALIGTRSHALRMLWRSSRREVSIAAVVLLVAILTYAVISGRVQQRRLAESYDAGFHASLLNEIAGALRADGYYDEALELLDGAKDAVGTAPLQSERILQKLVSARCRASGAAYSKGDLDAADAFVDDATRIADRMLRRDSNSATAIQSAGFCALMRAQIAGVRENNELQLAESKTALRFFARLPREYDTFRGEAGAYEHRGRAQSALGQSDAALDSYRLGLQARTRAHDERPGPESVTRLAILRALVAIKIVQSKGCADREVQTLIRDARAALAELAENSPMAAAAPEATQTIRVFERLAKKPHCAADGGESGGVGTSESSTSPSSSGSVSPTRVSE